MAIRLHAGFAVFAVAATLAAGTLAQDARPAYGAWGVDLTDQDRSIKPGDDFAMYQNGAWFNRTQLGPKMTAAAYWRDVRVTAAGQLSAILKELAQDRAAAPASPLGKAGAFFRAAMDETTIEAKGLRPLAPELDAIRAVKTKRDMARLIGQVEGPGTLRNPSVRIPPGRGIFKLAIGQDQADPNHYAVYVGQGGLMLPGPEYYTEASFADVRRDYEAHVARTLALIGWPEPEARARDILALETRIAGVSWSHEQMRDAKRTYNPISVAELARLAPGFDWKAYLQGAELSKVSRVVIDARGAFPEIAKIYAETPLEILRARQAYAAADIAAPLLNRPLRAEAGAFGAKVQQGLSFPSRDFEAEKWLEAAMPDTLGALYVARYSSPAIKAKAEEMVANMRRAFDARLAGLAWMSPEARAKAREKLARMQFHIGYPDRFEDYAGVTVDDTDFYGNVSRAAAWAWRRDVRRLNRPFDRNAWALTPIYPQYAYVPTTNTVEVPAALLSPPFFDPRADEAVNYGAVGTTIGAMIVNAFSVGGINYDADGRLNPWLPAADAARFDEMRARLSSRYSLEEPIPGMHLKGELVVDEAICDVGGVQIALDAYHASLNGRPAPVLDGYSGDQRFFLGRAQMWRAKFSAEFLRNQIATGTNSPPYMRINGPLPQVDGWYAAFQVSPGDKLYVAPEARLRLW